jgi:hypothetical protein
MTKQLVILLLESTIKADMDKSNIEAGNDLGLGVTRLFRRSKEKDRIFNIVKMKPWNPPIAKFERERQQRQDRVFPNQQWTPSWAIPPFQQGQHGVQQGAGAQGQRTPCGFCGKWSHAETSCWGKFPELRKNVN